jgi:transcriptional regulator with XRE-family HTH domain
MSNKVTEKMSLSSVQCRAARALLGWSQAHLSEASKVATKTIADFESSLREPQPRTLDELQRALEKEGVEFLNHGQPGVRLTLQYATSFFDTPLRVVSSSNLSVRLRTTADGVAVIVSIERAAIDDRFRLPQSTAQQRRDLVEQHMERIEQIAGQRYQRGIFSRGQIAGEKIVQIVLALPDFDL